MRMDIEDTKKRCEAFVNEGRGDLLTSIKELGAVLDKCDADELRYLRNHVRHLPKSVDPTTEREYASRRKLLIERLKSAERGHEKRGDRLSGLLHQFLGFLTTKIFAGLIVIIGTVYGVTIDWNSSDIDGAAPLGRAGDPEENVLRASNIRPIHYDIRFMRSPGGNREQHAFVEIEDRDTLFSGDVVRITFYPRGTGYAYIFLVDASGQTYTLFPPNPDVRASLDDSNPVRSRQYDLPSTAGAYSIDEMVGEETIYSVFVGDEFAPLSALAGELISRGRIDAAHVRSSYGSRLKRLMDEVRADCADCVRVTRFIHRK